MFEGYSQNVAVTSGGTIPIEVFKLNKGCYETPNGAGSIDLNHCGVYRVTVNGTVTPSDAGVFGVELIKDGVAQVNTLTQATVTASSLYPFSFTTYIQANRNNGNCACSFPTVINLVNTGVDAVYNINVTVDKVC